VGCLLRQKPNSPVLWGATASAPSQKPGALKR